MHRKYVAGFLFDQECSRVLLIRKLTPKWQAGLLNGIGGKVEPGETSLDAMVREFQEEAGLVIPDWQYFCTIRNKGVPGEVITIEFYRAKGDIAAAKSQEAEQIEIVHIQNLHLNKTIPNLHWLIPMALGAVVTADVVEGNPGG